MNGDRASNNYFKVPLFSLGEILARRVKNGKREKEKSSVFVVVMVSSFQAINSPNEQSKAAIFNHRYANSYLLIEFLS